VGSILPDYCSRDSRGIIINDPWSTPFNEGGFDLDAIGVIHTLSQNAVSFTDNFGLKFYPNPIQHDLIIETDKTVDYELYNLQGSLIYSGIVDSKQTLDCTNLQSGIYMLKIGNKGYKVVKI
jgi:hypothetical protein